MRAEAAGVERYAPDVEATVYFCVLEALQNLQKCANATRVVLTLREEAETLHVEVSDDGAGFDTTEAKKGAGLNNMADRLDALGGNLDVMSDGALERAFVAPFEQRRAWQRSLQTEVSSRGSSRANCRAARVERCAGRSGWRASPETGSAL